jgi:hypothetical protein
LLSPEFVNAQANEFLFRVIQITKHFLGRILGNSFRVKNCLFLAVELLSFFLMLITMKYYIKQHFIFLTNVTFWGNFEFLLFTNYSPVCSMRFGFFILMFE